MAAGVGVEQASGPGPVAPARNGGQPSNLIRGLHLLVLWSFALAQPTFAELETAADLFNNAGGIDLVLFALGITLLPPAILLLVELAAARAGPRVLTAVHLVLVAGLVALIASPIIFRVLSPSSLVQSALAITVGVALGIAYARLKLVRSLTTALVVAPALFVLTFLFTPPISYIVLEGEPASRSTSAQAPVVFVVFDEFSSAALMNSSGELDAERYPNFARLARDGTWFRNAATNYSFTERAVPAMLTGHEAPDDAVPWGSDYPRNLFTMLGGYEIDAVEQVTDLCPERLCPERGSFPGRLPDLYRDMGLLGLRAVLPDAIGFRLPEISTAELTPQESFSQFMRGLRSVQRRTLDFGHFSIPHLPHDRLPSGKRYPMMVRDAGRIQALAWIDNPWLAIQGYQRYLLQVGYTDRLVGKLLDRLQEAGVYDDAAVIVTADHGVSHRPGEARREALRTNLEEIVPVPLFVKAPHQRRGRVVDRHVQTLDVLPTLTDTLGIRPPTGAEGGSALDPGHDRRRLSVANLGGDPLTIDVRTLQRRLSALVRRQARLFGEGDDPEALYLVGLDRDLRGRRIDTLPVRRSDDASARILDPKNFAYDPQDDFVPARLVGQVSGAGARAGMELVVALKGRIWAATETYESGGDQRFIAMLPPSQLRPGRNTVEIFAVSGSGPSRQLELLGRSR